MSTFEVREVFRLAMQIEQNGGEFYMAAQAAAQAPEVKKIFAFLAHEEARHLSFFQRCFERLNADASVTFPKTADEYLKFLADHHVFHQLLDAQNFAKITAVGDIIRKAAQFEKDSILLFTEIARLVDAHDRPALEQIVEEEKKHLLSVYHVLEQIKQQ